MGFDYTVITEKPLNRAAEDVKAALKDFKFGTLWEFDVRSKLEEKGVQFNGNAIVLEVCNPHRAKEALENNMNVIHFLPCKIVVYEDKDKTKLGMVKPTIFMEMLDSDLQDFAQDVENTLKQVLEKAK